MSRKRKLNNLKTAGRSSQSGDEDIVSCSYEAFMKLEDVNKRLSEPIDSVHGFYVTTLFLS